MEIVYKEKSFTKKSFIILLTALLAILLLSSSLLSNFANAGGGGATSTTSPPGDHLPPMDICVGKTSQTNAIGHLALSSTFWTAQVVYGSEWLTISRTTFQGNGVLSYTILANNQPNTRDGIIMVAGKEVLIRQKGTNDGGPCPATISPNNIISPKTAGVFRLYVSSETNQMNWDAVVSPNDKSWINVTKDVDMNYVDVEISPNSSIDRITFITIDDVKVPIIQRGNTPKL